jgi:hypothetical protein
MSAHPLQQNVVGSFGFAVPVGAPPVGAQLPPLGGENVAVKLPMPGLPVRFTQLGALLSDTVAILLRQFVVDHALSVPVHVAPEAAPHPHEVHARVSSTPAKKRCLSPKPVGHGLSPVLMMQTFATNGAVGRETHESVPLHPVAMPPSIAQACPSACQVGMVSVGSPPEGAHDPPLATVPATYSDWLHATPVLCPGSQLEDCPQNVWPPATTPMLPLESWGSAQVVPFHVAGSDNRWPQFSVPPHATS